MEFNDILYNFVYNILNFIRFLRIAFKNVLYEKKLLTIIFPCMEFHGF